MPSTSDSTETSISVDEILSQLLASAQKQMSLFGSTESWLFQSSPVYLAVTVASTGTLTDPWHVHILILSLAVLALKIIREKPTLSDTTSVFDLATKAEALLHGYPFANYYRLLARVKASFPMRGCGLSGGANGTTAGQLLTGEDGISDWHYGALRDDWSIDKRDRSHEEAARNQRHSASNEAVTRADGPRLGLNNNVRCSSALDVFANRNDGLSANSAHGLPAWEWQSLDSNMVGQEYSNLQSVYGESATTYLPNWIPMAPFHLDLQNTEYLF